MITKLGHLRQKVRLHFSETWQ